MRTVFFEHFLPPPPLWTTLLNKSTWFMNAPISRLQERYLFSDVHDGFLTQSVVSQNGKRRIQTVSCTLEDFKTKSN